MTMLYITLAGYPASLRFPIVIYFYLDNNDCSCFLVDETGYVIIHPDFMHPPTGPTTIPHIEQVHITQKVSTALSP